MSAGLLVEEYAKIRRRRRAQLLISADRERILFGCGWDDFVHAEILDKLAIMIGDMPDGGYSKAKFGVGTGVGAVRAIARCIYNLHYFFFIWVKASCFFSPSTTRRSS